MLPIFAGLLAGSAHVISGPDHLAALAPIALEAPKSARSMGMRWGLGHGIGVLILGGIGVLSKETLDLNVISAWSEFLVGFILMAVGLWAFYKAKGIVVHSHPHDHSDSAHDHVHIHTQTEEHSHQSHHSHGHTAFWVGMLHGSAGGGHLFGVLPSLAFGTVDACIYLASYFIAAVVSMAIFAEILGFISLRQGPHILQRLMYSVSLLVLSIGGVWSYNAWPL